ncbi:MAG TPA: DinB family protein [Ktedonobacterales bacterium]|jgi:uncharacterized damage-inducible protein DinB
MAQDNFTLTTFYENWKTYQDHIRSALAPLTAEQLALRPAPHLRSVGENAAHIIGCRIGWFTQTMHEDGGAHAQLFASWSDKRADASGAEFVRGLDASWDLMAGCLARWSDDDMRQIFDDDWGNGNIVHLSRAWIVWHVMEHDLHHGGELAFTLGMHGIPAEFPG